MKKKTPKYQNIKYYLTERISSGEISGPVPSENELARMFEVSRMTARRALEDLERDGLVERIPGRGTFVRPYRHYTRGFFRVRPFRKWADDLKANLTTRVLEARLIKNPPSKPAELLQSRDSLILLRILNSFDDIPVRYAVRYLLADKCAAVLDKDLEAESIHDLLINHLNIPLTRITQNMTAEGLSEEMASLFNEKPGRAIFHFRRLIYSFDTPITYVEYFMKGDMAFEDSFTPQFEQSDFIKAGSI